MRDEPICANCHKHKGTIKWIGGGGELDFAHGFWEWRCECCSVAGQLEHAREMAAKIPQLETRLEEPCHP